MSLRSFHIFFIIVSDLLSAGFAVWAIRQARQTNDGQFFILGATSLLVAMALALYLFWFIRKSKKASI